ncbi:hemerythrin domain-containing protein [Rathayibacter sp. CAU 1779]
MNPDQRATSEPNLEGERHAEGSYDNDTRGWLLVHEQIRAVVSDASRQVRAARADDLAAVGALVAWWASFSRSFVHHMHTEDTRIWPELATSDPRSSDALARLTDQHRDLELRLAALDGDLREFQVALRHGPGGDERATLLAELAELDTSVASHLAEEERTAFAIGRTAVRRDEWASIEKDMVKGLPVRDLAMLAPRILQQADDEGRAMMLRRLPGPLRVVVVRVFEPRYRRIRARLPEGRIVPRA